MEGLISIGEQVGKRLGDKHQSPIAEPELKAACEELASGFVTGYLREFGFEPDGTWQFDVTAKFVAENE